MKTFLAIAVLVLPPQLPPVPLAEGPRVSIEGVVVDAESRPVAGADIRASFWPPPAAYSPSSVPRAVTDKDGNFALHDLGAGSYRVGASAGGYARQDYGAGTVITLTPGQSLQGIVIRLVREGIVTGQITSTGGAPLLKMEVLAFRRIYNANGWPVLSTYGLRGETNDRGEYRLAGLPPGRYYIWAASPFLGGTASDEARAARRDGLPAPASPTPGQYGPVFYPGVSDSSKAAMVDVHSGQESTKVDLVLPRVQLYKIRGHVTESGGGLPTRKVSLGTIPADGKFVTGTTLSVAGPAYDIAGNLISAYRPDGTFELTDITPGTYWLNAQLQVEPLTAEQRLLVVTPGADMARLPVPTRGATRVTVVDSDVENVEVTVVYDPTIRGSVRVEGGAAVPLDSLNVELRPVTLGSMGPVFGTLKMAPDATFTYTNMPAGEYRFSLSGVPADFYVQQARLGTIDALSQLLTLTRQPDAPLQITLAKGAAVSGAVTDASSRPVPSQQVVLIPDRMPNRPDLYKTATTDANGRFTMQGVAPGDYKAYAWKTIEPYRYFDSEFLRGFEDRGSIVRVTETSGATVDVRLIP
jgi:hypothetical protein